MFRNRLSISTRTVLSAAALATSGLFLVTAATPAFAGSAPAYRLAPVAALAAADTVVVRDTLWSCTETSCVAKASTSRPAIVCATAARKIGKLSSFTANGKAFSEEELAACNARAK